MQKIKLETSLFLLSIITIIFMLLFHLYFVTILYNKYTAMSKQNRLLEIDIPPQRGNILTENKIPLTENKPSYVLIIKKKQDLNYLLKNYTNIYKKLIKFKKLNFPLSFNITEKQGTLLLTDIHKPNSIIVSTSIQRIYKYPYQFAHVLGYTSNIFAEDLKKDPTLHYNDIIGRIGLEKEYDKYLRGKHGIKIVEINSSGRILQTNSSKTKPAVNGATIITSINLKMQNELYNALENVTNKYHIKGGAAVILNVNNGQVKAIVSYPSFNLNKFSKGISIKDYNALIKDKRKPLFNRAIMAQAPPGSTFKTMVAIAALQEKAITPYTKFYSSGTIKLAGGTLFQEYHKHVYGWLTVKDALMVSSNIFFCKTILKLGINKLDKYLEYFNIGKPTGIDLPGEASGRMPSIKNKIELAKNGAYWLEPIWYPEGDSCNSAIGQGITLLTPIQLAVVAASIANNGTVYQPRIAEKIITKKKTILIKPHINHKIPASKDVFEVVKQGMYMSVHGPRGIIPNLRNVPVDVAAKTGTAEFGIKTKEGYLTTHAWVMGFYPFHKPKYAFTVFLEGGGSSLHAAEVMQNFLNAFYK